MLLIVSMVVGTVAGQLVDIEGALNRLGDWLHKKVGRAGQEGCDTAGSRFIEGFVTSSLIICVGAMAVVGGLYDGMGQPETLFAKAALDFVIVLMLASTLGAGVAFSALPILVYQGLLATVGLLVGNVMTDAMTSGLSLVGNVLVCAVGLNLLLQTFPGNLRISVGNMLPALLVPVVWEVSDACGLDATSAALPPPELPGCPHKLQHRLLCIARPRQIHWRESLGIVDPQLYERGRRGRVGDPGPPHGHSRRTPRRGRRCA